LYYHVPWHFDTPILITVNVILVEGIDIAGSKVYTYVMVEIVKNKRALIYSCN